MNTSSLHISLLLMVTFISACQPVVMIPTNQKLIITNEIFKTDVVGESDFTMVIDGVVFTAEPVDSRAFDGNREYMRSMSFDGGFNFVNVTLAHHGVFPDTSNELDFSTRGLLPKLMDAGINNEHSRSIVRQVSEDLEYTQRLIVAKDDYHTESIVGADPVNPFTLDKRYLTVFKLALSNQGNLMKEFCLPTIRLHTESNVYEPFDKEKLLDAVPYGTIPFEVLNQLLAAKCTVLPPQTTIDRYLTFPAVIYNDMYRLTAQTGNQMNSVMYFVARSSFFEKFVFNPARILTKESGAIITSVPSSTSGIYSYSEIMRSSFIFLESENDVTRVDNNELLVQENMESGVYHIIVVQRQGDVYSVSRVPLDPSTLVDGVILVEVGG